MLSSLSWETPASICNDKRHFNKPKTSREAINSVNKSGHKSCHSTRKKTLIDVANSRVFFITDVHGSTKCFKKFLNAAKFYKVNVLVLGGDLTGKVLIPIIEQGDGSFKCTFEGDVICANFRI